MSTTNSAPALKRETGQNRLMFVRAKGNFNGVMFSDFVRVLASFDDVNLDDDDPKIRDQNRKEYGMDQPVSKYIKPVFWVELLTHLEDKLGLANVMTEAWEALGGGRPNVMYLENIDDRVTIYRLYLFISECPLSSGVSSVPKFKLSQLKRFPYGENLPIEDVIRYLVKDFVNFGDNWLNIPDSFRLDLTEHHKTLLFNDFVDCSVYLDFNFVDQELDDLLNKQNLVLRDLIDFAVRSKNATNN